MCGFFLRFSTDKIMSLAVKMVTFLPFQSGCLLFPFCLIPLARTSSTVLNRSGESRHIYLVPEFRGKAFSLSLLSMMLAEQRIFLKIFISKCLTDS